jgi:hypothetical protein
LIGVIAGLLIVRGGRATANDLVQALPPSTACEGPALLFDPGVLPLDVPPRKRIQPIPDVRFCNPWTWQILPEGLIYKSYLAGGREPRISGLWAGTDDGNSVWDITLGGRAGILRYGTQNLSWPEGWQLDVEGAAFPRLTLDSQRDLVAVDCRFGVPLTYRQGPWETKLAYYHLSSHLGDEYLLKHPAVQRINYARDAFVAGVGWRPHSDWRFYGEVGYAVYVSGGAEPWELQFGIEYSPARPATVWGAPFLAVNSRLRQEVDFGGSLAAETGWQWWGPSGHLFRFGFRYFNGMSDQYQFHNQFEEQFSLGLWYDF